MTNKLLGLAVAVALPTMVAAQTPQIPNEHGHSQAAAHRAKHRRGDVVTVAHTRNPNAATPAVRATPAAGHAGRSRARHRPYRTRQARYARGARSQGRPVG